MVKQIRRLICAAAALVLMLAAGAGGEMAWEAATPAQQMLKEYMARVNQYLTAGGELPVNRLFEMYPGIAVMGITADREAEVPEGVEITVTMLPDRMDQLQLRVSNDPDRFSRIAACLIRAVYGENISEESALAKPAERAGRVKQEPMNSFEEEIDSLSGTVPRFYYAYYPNQYHDGQNWMQMTVIFPQDAAWSGNEMITGTTEGKGVDLSRDVSEDYEGYFSTDDYTHYEIFLTPTPEPDSAAAEYDFH